MEAWEIVNALQVVPEGQTIASLLKKFSNRVGDGPGQMNRKAWIKLVKDNSNVVNADGKTILRAKVPKPGDSQ